MSAEFCPAWVKHIIRDGERDREVRIECQRAGSRQAPHDGPHRAEVGPPVMVGSEMVAQVLTW